MSSIIRLCDWLGRVIPGPVGRWFSDCAFDWRCSHSPEFIETLAKLKVSLENAPPTFRDSVPKVSWQHLLADQTAKKAKEEVE